VGAALAAFFAAKAAPTITAFYPSYLVTVPKAELIYGAYKSSRIEQNLAKLDILFLFINSLPFDGNAAREFGEIRAYPARQGTPIGPYDLQIAAIAKVHDLILVTHNTREFSRVLGLRVEDWQLP